MSKDEIVFVKSSKMDFNKFIDNHIADNLFSLKMHISIPPAVQYYQ